MSPGRRVLAGGAALLAAALIAAGSRAPVTFSPADAALLRLSWRLPGVATEACRELSEEELARLPVHMRNPSACIGVIASYLLEVRLNGTLLASDTVAPPGARGDRPLNVLREYPLDPGDHRLDVTFRALLPEDVPLPDGGVREVGWEGSVTVAPGDVALLALHPDRARLELRGGR
ncbi:MAG: hypothetical protein RQ751_12255 [Longimicrobiales bacterium]|nr:hypothetical protein [Longimicrobiales bacterium]